MVLIVSLFGLIQLADVSDADDLDVQLYEIKPAQSDEGFGLINYSNEGIDLKGYYVSNGVGKVSFRETLILGPGETLIVVGDDSSSPYFLNREGHPYKVWGESGITGDNFELYDEGFTLCLYKNGTIIDEFCYGDTVVEESSHWTGRTFAIMPQQTNAFVVRASSDVVGANAWHRWGTTYNLFDPELEFDAEISPFLFPECGGIPIYRALEQAKTSLSICMYQITSLDVIGCLAECVKRGVSVNILLEGHTASGYMDGNSTHAKMLKYLSDLGADIKVMTRADESSDDLHRYFYLHAKYCIIDGEAVIVESENWDAYGFTNKVVTNPEEGYSRGWGVIVKSKDYADFMQKVFDNDTSMEYGDVFNFADVFPKTESLEAPYNAPTDQYPMKTFKTTVTPMLSPDSSWDGTLHYVDSANSRIDIEMLSITDSFYEEGVESPLSHLIKKAESTDTRVLICMDHDKSGVLQHVSYLNNETKIKAGFMAQPFLHNKGLVLDDTVIVSSINWTTTGFYLNREIGVVIHSKELADYFASIFDSDFERNYRNSGLSVEINGISSVVNGITQITADANVVQTGKYTYTWVLDDVRIPSSGNQTTFDTEVGQHTLKVIVMDEYMTVGEKTITFEAQRYKIETSVILIITSVAALMIAAAAIILWRHRRSGSL